MDHSEKLGALTAEVTNLKHEIGCLRDDIKEIRNHLELLKQWKAQVIGISLAVSFITSVLLSGLIAIRQWK